MALAADNGIADLIRRFCNIRAEFVGEAVGHVLRVPTVIAITAEPAIEIQRRHRLGHEGAVDGNLVHVGANAMVLRITVEEHAELQERIGAVFDAWDHAAGGEGRLLNIAVVILGVLVQGQFPKIVHGKLVAWPDFGDVEGVETQLFEIGFLRLHDLHFGGPGWVLTVFDGIPKIALGVVGVGAAELGRFGSGELFLAMIGYEVVFDVHLHGQCGAGNDEYENQRLTYEFALLVDPLERMAAVAMLVAPSLRSAMVAEKHEPCMVGLRRTSQKIKK